MKTITRYAKFTDACGDDVRVEGGEGMDADKVWVICRNDPTRRYQHQKLHNILLTRTQAVALRDALNVFIEARDA